MQNLESRAEQSRFVGFDILKTICAFLVVCIHAPFPGSVGEYFTAICRVAVPVFFMITGFFYSDVKWRRAEKKQIEKVIKLFVFSSLLYIVWNCTRSFLSGGNVADCIVQMFGIKKILRLLVLNESPFNGHLWYIGALLYTLIVFYVIKQEKIMYCLTPFLLVGDLLLGKYSLLIWGREFPYVLVRNFLFVGIPYFCIGDLLHKVKGKNKKYKSFLSGMLCLVFVATTILERYVLVSLKANATRDHYLSTTLFAVSVFIFVCGLYENRKISKIESIMASIGRYYSTEIYIIHPIIITVLSIIVERTGLISSYSYVRPVIVFLASTGIVALMKKGIRA